MQWVGRLRTAIAEHRLRLHYQILKPVQAGAKGEGVHFELLLRLLDDDGTLVQPGAFIPSAERFGMMPKIDRWVVEQAITHFDHLFPDAARVARGAITRFGHNVDGEFVRKGELTRKGG